MAPTELFAASCYLRHTNLLATRPNACAQPRRQSTHRADPIDPARESLFVSCHRLCASPRTSRLVPARCNPGLFTFPLLQRPQQHPPMRAAAKLISQLHAGAAGSTAVAACQQAARSAGRHHGAAASGSSGAAQSLRTLFADAGCLSRSCAAGATRVAHRVGSGCEASRLQRASAILGILSECRAGGSCAAPRNVAIKRLCPHTGFQTRLPAAPAAWAAAGVAAAAIRGHCGTAMVQRFSAMAIHINRQSVWAAASRSICTGSRAVVGGSRVYCPAVAGRAAAAYQAGAQSARSGLRGWSSATVGGSGCNAAASGRYLAAAQAARNASYRQRNAFPAAVVARRAFATWSDVAPRGWSQHGGFRVLQSRGADVDPMTVVYTLMGAKSFASVRVRGRVGLSLVVRKVAVHEPLQISNKEGTEVKKNENRCR